MATTVFLEVSVGVDVAPAALEHWVFAQLNMPGLEKRFSRGRVDVREEDLDAIDEFGGEFEVQRFEPVIAELCETEEPSMDMIEMAAMESPARYGVSEHWPEKWGRVPKRVMMLCTALPDYMLLMVNPKLRGLAAVKGQDYQVWVNSHGAVSAILPGGQRLGLLPAEFEVVEFHDSPLIRQSEKDTSSRAVGTISQYPAAVEEPEDEA